MPADLAKATPRVNFGPSLGYTIFALTRAGFRRYATYRQATIAAAITNSIFGLLRCYVLLATLAGTGAAVVEGYSREQLATYCWVSQGLLGIVLLWGWTELGDRIRSGDVVTDLLRPIHPVVAYLAIDCGRAGYASLIRLFVPLAVGATFFDLYRPRHLSTYALIVVSVGLSVVISFACRYLVNAVGFWLLDIRGMTLMWAFGVSVFSGLAFPLHFLPSWLVWTVWVLTPFPSMLQAPLDVVVERGSVLSQAGVVAGQAAWAAVTLMMCWYVQRRAERMLVIQGG